MEAAKAGIEVDKAVGVEVVGMKQTKRIVESLGNADVDMIETASSLVILT